MGKAQSGSSQSESKAGETPPSGQNTQDTNTSSGETPGGSSAEGFHAEDFNPQVAQTLIESLRETEKSLRNELKVAKSQVTDFEAQGLSELEAATSKVSELTANNQIQQQELRDLKVRLQASALGITDPMQQQAASGLLDWGKLGDEPEPKAIEAELNKLLTNAPWLKSDTRTAQQQPKVQPTNPQRQGQQGQSSLADWLGDVIGSEKSGDRS